MRDLPEAETAVRSALMSEIVLLRERRKSDEDRMSKLEAQVSSIGTPKWDGELNVPCKLLVVGV